MIKKIALAAVAACVLAGPAFASTKLETPDTKDMQATVAIAKTSLQQTMHKITYRKNMERPALGPSAS
jgi:hypothetical protein